MLVIRAGCELRESRKFEELKGACRLGMMMIQSFGYRRFCIGTDLEFFYARRWIWEFRELAGSLPSRSIKGARASEEYQFKVRVKD